MHLFLSAFMGGSTRFWAPFMNDHSAVRSEQTTKIGGFRKIHYNCKILDIWYIFERDLTKSDMVEKYLHKIKRYQFLFEELVKRDFKKRYSSSVLGVLWSILMPMLQLLVMRLVFTQFFGRNTPHYTTYLFCGVIVFNYFSESTREGMTSLQDNSGIFTKINVPKYLFLFSKNVQALINFMLILVVFFIFCILDHVTFTWKMLMLIYPIFFLVIFNTGIGLILSALYVFFKDMKYLWSIITMSIQYFSAVFYRIEAYSPKTQKMFYLNPVFLYIRYFRKIVLDASIPQLSFHALIAAEALIVFTLGVLVYKKYNLRFMFYL